MRGLLGDVMLAFVDVEQNPWNENVALRTIEHLNSSAGVPHQLVVIDAGRVRWVQSDGKGRFWRGIWVDWGHCPFISDIFWVNKQEKKKEKNRIYQKNNGAHQNHKVSKFTALPKRLGGPTSSRHVDMKVKKWDGWFQKCFKYWRRICYLHPYLGKWSNLTCAYFVKWVGEKPPTRKIRLPFQAIPGDSWADVHERFAWTPSQRCVSEGSLILLNYSSKMFGGFWGLFRFKPESRMWDLGLFLDRVNTNHGGSWSETPPYYIAKC